MHNYIVRYLRAHQGTGHYLRILSNKGLSFSSTKAGMNAIASALFAALPNFATVRSNSL